MKRGRRFARTGRRFLYPSPLTVGFLLLVVIMASSGVPAAVDARQTPEPGVDFPAAIDRVIPQDGGVYGFVVQDPESGTLYSHNATVPFVSASLYKLPLMAHIFQLAENRQLSLTDFVVLEEWFWSEGDDSYYGWEWVGAAVSIDELLFAMGAWSSNVAAWALASLVQWYDVQQTTIQIGMTSTLMLVTTPELPGWPPPAGESDRPEAVATAVGFIDAVYGWNPVMISTPQDIATFFAGLLAGTIVNLEASWAMIGILSQQAIADRFPALLPGDAWMAHKTGNLSQVIHDAGIIYTATGPVIVVGMSEAMPDESIAVGALQQLALTVYTYFNAHAAAES